MSDSGIIMVGAGDFTLLKYIATLNAEELERTVGFEKGRLKAGFLIVALAGNELMSSSDFDLGASTRYSGGVVKRSATGQAVGIEAILSARGQDPVALKDKVATFFSKRGGNTPAKVLPNLRHTVGMMYPDAEALGPGIRSGIPQFKLLKPKKFVIIRDEK